MAQAPLLSYLISYKDDGKHTTEPPGGFSVELYLYMCLSRLHRSVNKFASTIINPNQIRKLSLTIMKKDDKLPKDKQMDRKVRHPTASFSTKSIIMNLIIAFFLYLLRRTIEAGGKSAITKYSKFIK
uniref:Uncharacterized protein n=1 Tax=Anopheles funestus TaxID=62324 RepID=A0A182RBK4_ANOFN